MNFPYLSLITFLPVLGSLVILLLPRDKERVMKGLSVAIALVTLILAALVWLGYDYSSGSIQFEEVHSWIPAINVRYRLGVDGISVPLVFLTALLATISLFYSSYTIHERVKEYFALFLLLATGMFGVFVSLDFFLFYVFWEIGLVPMYFLIGVWGGPRREYAAIKFFLYTLAGSVLMLLAILAMYFDQGTFDILQLAQSRPFAGNFALQSLAFWGIFAAFAIKVPMWPFHTWLPDAHVEAPTAGSIILAGILLKLGGYGFFRVLLPIFPAAFQRYALIIAILALLSIVYGALVSLAQWDLKKLIAYSSVNHMGYVMLGVAAAAFAIGGPERLFDSRAMALNGAVLQMFNHGIITGGLFLLVGVIYERAHTRDLKAFGGLGTIVPVYYGIVVTTCLASLGLPGLAGFISEFLVFRGALGIITPIAVIAVSGIVVTAAMFLWKVIQLIFLGPLNEKWAKLPDMHRWEVISMAPLIFFMIFFGLYPTPILNLINGAVVRLLGGL